MVLNLCNSSFSISVDDSSRWISKQYIGLESESMANFTVSKKIANKNSISFLIFKTVCPSVINFITAANFSSLFFSVMKTWHNLNFKFSEIHKKTPYREAKSLLPFLVDNFWSKLNDITALKTGPIWIILLFFWV